MLDEDGTEYTPWKPERAVNYYRLEDSPYADHEPRLLTYYLVRKTARGAWVVPSYSYYRRAEPLEAASATFLRDEFGARFVLDGKGRRYCYPSMDDARESYRIRKQRQIQHARNAIERAEAALHWLDTGQMPRKSYLHFFVDTPPTLA